MLLRSPRHRAGNRPRWAARWRRRLAAFDDWRQVLTLRVVVPVILAAVSAYYLTRWAHENAMPWALAWTIPAALDVSAYMAVLVAMHPVSAWARWRAYLLAALCMVLSVAGNIGSHAIDFGVLAPNFWTVAATASVYPLVLIAGHLVAVGMAPRPLTAAQQAELDRERIAAQAAVDEAQEQARAARARRRAAQVPAPDPAAPTQATARPVTRSAAQGVTQLPPPPAQVVAQPAQAPAPGADPAFDRAVLILRSQRGWGRGRAVLRDDPVLRDQHGVTDHIAKTRLHPQAKAEAERLGRLSDEEEAELARTALAAVS